MRVFIAGASGVLGIRVIPLLVARGDTVMGMTRTPAKANVLRDLGATPLVCDVYDAAALRTAVSAFAPDVILDELTDLADEERDISVSANARIRTEGTRNLLDAAQGVRVLAQSIAWTPTGEAGRAVAEHERLVRESGGVVIRYGQLYGPGTYHKTAPETGTHIDIDQAARRTLEAFDAPPGAIVTLVE